MSESQINLPAPAPASVLPDSSTAAVPSLDSSSASEFFRSLISFPAMLASLLVGAVFTTGRLFRVDPDLWWHVKVGEEILRTHHWPTTDLYSFTVNGQPWLAYEWFGEILSACAARLGGVVGLEILLLLVGSAVVLSIYALATLRAHNSKAGFIAAAILLLLTTVSFSLRPQMLGYWFLVLTLIALERLRQGKPRALFFLPLLMLVWVNTHGSWIIGLGAIFVYWMCGLVAYQLGDLEIVPWTSAERVQISFVFLLCLAVLPITPYGTRVALSPFEFAFSLPLNVRYIQEWQVMPFNSFGGMFFLLLVLGFVFLQITLRFRWRLEELLLFLFGTMMACKHVRFLLVFVPFSTPLLAVIFSRWMDSYHRAKDKLLLNAVLMLGIAVGIVHYFPKRAALDKIVAEQFPSRAVAYLQQHPAPEPMFNSYGFGGYLVYARGPEHKVFIDGRGDVYERGGVLADYKHISQLAPGAFAVLRFYGIRSCLIGPNDPLATALSALPNWKRVYLDNVSALYVRTAP